MNDQAQGTATTLSAYSLAYWRFCSIALGLALLVSLAVHAGGPAPARAGDAGPRPHTDARSQPVYQPPHQPQSRSQGGARALSIGGFDSIAGSPVFVIVDADGHRVGTLPMTAGAGPGE